MQKGIIMEMYCNQCQEAAKGVACVVKGVCGKDADVANEQELLLRILGEMAYLDTNTNSPDEGFARLLVDLLYTTVTNVNFDESFFISQIRRVMAMRDHRLKENLKLPFIPVTMSNGLDEIRQTAGEFGEKHGADAKEHSDEQALRDLILYGLKGMSAYAHHAAELGITDEEVHGYMIQTMGWLMNPNLSVDELTGEALRCGEYGVKVMAMLDRAHRESYGEPEPTEVNIGVRNNPGILISGHDLRDLEDLLVQTEGTGVDVYTHSEMLPGHYYPAFRKYEHFVGNYGGAWWEQKEEFEQFNGPILMTTNCLVPPKNVSYGERLFTTGTVGFEGLKHIADRENGGRKDFSAIIEQAKTCPPPKQLEEGSIVGGFAHNAILSRADAILDAVKGGKIRKFVVMAGCDANQRGREYYTDFAKELPEDSIILTAGCAKYRYNKLPLGDIGGIPRILDAGQCNDSYSLAVVAMKLAETLNVEINDLPISYNIAWYEQKAVIVLLALLHLGVKNIHLGPTLPPFLSPNVIEVLVNQFGLAGIGSVREDLNQMVGAV